MAYSPTMQSGELHCLIEVSLDSTTLLYCDEDLSLSTAADAGRFYEGRLSKGARLVRTLGTAVEARETVDTFTVALDNSDSRLSTLIRDCTFGNRAVRVFVGEGKTKSNYSMIFKGFIAHPNGVSWDDKQAQLTLVDQRVRYRKILPHPNSVYDYVTYPNMIPNMRGAVIPIVYGDWSANVGLGVSVPAVCIDKRDGYRTYKICSHPIYNISRYLQNAVEIDISGHVSDVDLDAATFSLADMNGDLNATNDIISVNCKGVKNTGGSDCLSTPAEVLKHILITHLGLSTDDMNMTAFNTFDSDVGSMVVRRVIDSQEGSDTIISALINECNCDLRIEGGKFSPKYRQLDDASLRQSWTDVDLVLADEKNESFEFHVERDPDRFFSNQINGRYEYNPIDARFESKHVDTDLVSIARYNATVQRTMDFMWLYRTADVETRTERELVNFAVEPISIETVVTRRALLKNLADQINLEHDIFRSDPLQIRSLDLDLSDFTTRVRAVKMFSDTWGYWMPDTAPDYASATEAEKRASGFWTDDNGLADPSDPNSNTFTWY